MNLVTKVIKSTCILITVSFLIGCAYDNSTTENEKKQRFIKIDISSHELFSNIYIMAYREQEIDSLYLINSTERILFENKTHENISRFFYRLRGEQFGNTNIESFFKSHQFELNGKIINQNVRLIYSDVGVLNPIHKYEDSNESVMVYILEKESKLYIKTNNKIQYVNINDIDYKLEKVNKELTLSMSLNNRAKYRVYEINVKNIDFTVSRINELEFKDKNKNILKYNIYYLELSEAPMLLELK